MNLDSPFAFIFFVFFLAPGLYFDFLSKRHRGLKKETQLQEFGKIVLASSFFSGLSVLTVLWFKNIFFLRNFEIKEMVRDPANFYLLHSSTFVQFLFTACSIAFVYALLFDNFLIALQDPKFTSESIWTHFFSNTSPKVFHGWRYPFVRFFNSVITGMRKLTRRQFGSEDEIETAVLVSTKDGKNVVGIIALWSSEENVYGREIMLAPLKEVYLSRLPQEFRDVLRNQESWQKTWIPEAAVITIKSVYLIRTEENA